MVLRGLQAHKVCKVFKVWQAQPVLKGYRAIQEPPAQPARKVFKVLQVPLVRRGYRVFKE